MGEGCVAVLISASRWGDALLIVWESCCCDTHEDLKEQSEAEAPSVKVVTGVLSGHNRIHVNASGAAMKWMQRQDNQEMVALLC